MDREGAETHLRLLAEATMRRSLEAAREKPGPPDPGGHRAKLMAVGQALVTVGALDIVTLETLLVDFNLAMSVRQLSAGEEPGPAGAGTSRAIKVARLFGSGQSPHQMPVAWGVRLGLGRPLEGAGPPGPGPQPPGPAASEVATQVASQAASQVAGTGPDDVAADRFVPVGLKVPFHYQDVHGELYLMAFVHTGAGPRFFSLWNIRAPALQDADLIPFGGFNVTDDRGTRYRLDFTPSGGSGWASEIGLRPAPPPGVRRLAINAPGYPAVGIDLDPQPPGAGVLEVREVQRSSGEVLLVMLAERLLAAVSEPPRAPWRRSATVASPALRSKALWLGDIVAALEAAGVLSPHSPEASRLATLCASLDIPEHGITVPPAPRLPEPWLSVLAHYQRRKPEPVPLLEGYAAMATVLPELNGIQLTMLGLHHSDGDSSLHVLVRGQLPEGHLGPFGTDPTFSLSIWLRDSGGRWHVARPVERHQGGRKDGEWTMRLQLVPPLTRATPWVEVLAAGQSAEVHANLPLRWGFPS